MTKRMGSLSNIKAIFLISLFLLGSFLALFSSSASSGGISVWPPEVTVNINDKFPEKEIKFKIQVNNLYNNTINVSAKIENQIPYHLKENYTNVPDLSWIKITPNLFNLSAKKSKVLEVTINVPDEERSLYYNKKWEACVVISEIKDKPSLIATEYAIRIYIITPEKAELKINDILLFLIVVGSGALLIYSLYFIKEKKKFGNNKTALFYFKKKKNGK